MSRDGEHQIGAHPRSVAPLWITRCSAQRPGRIPGSVNVPAADLQHPQTKEFVGLEKAARQFETVGVKPDQRVLVYCGGGIAATLDAYMLHQLGYENIAVYDNSMSEWSTDESLPIEKG